MKYILLVGDGMADHPHPDLNGRTPLQVAKTPHLDFLVQKGFLGTTQTLIEGYPLGSDVANLAVLGYNPRDYYSGRAPLEAANIGIDLKPPDVAFRCNLVTILGQVMADYSAGHITTEEAKPLIKMLDQKLGNAKLHFYAGTSYRHLLVWQGGPLAARCVPPHDISSQSIEDYWPKGAGHKLLRQIMEDSRLLLEGHEINRERRQAGKPPANMIWLWGQGKKPHLPTLTERYQISGSVISAVDLVKGIGIYAGLSVVKVPGATGYLDTNYQGKAEAALTALKKQDFVFVHVEAPDECGHNGDVAGKIKAIEDFDTHIVGRILQGLQGRNDFRLLVLPDHPTPLDVRTHTNESVPFVLYSAAQPTWDWQPQTIPQGYDEEQARATGRHIPAAWKLLDVLILDQWPKADETSAAS